MVARGRTGITVVCRRLRVIGAGRRWTALTRRVAVVPWSKAILASAVRTGWVGVYSMVRLPVRFVGPDAGSAMDGPTARHQGRQPLTGVFDVAGRPQGASPVRQPPVVDPLTQ